MKTSMYPNPATGDYLYIQTVSGAQSERLEVSLYDLTGDILFKEFFEPGSIIIPIHDISDGIYLIKVKNNSGVTIFKSIISRFQ